MKKITKDTFLISDTHFHHTNILKYSPIRVELIKKYNKESKDKLIQYLWNQRISKNDTIIHLGDAYMKDQNINLNGIKYLLKGNHDKLSNKFYHDNGFNIIHQEIQIDSLKQDNKLMKKLKDINKAHKMLNYIIFGVDHIRFLISHFQMINTTKFDKKFEKQISALKYIYDITGCNYNIHGHTHVNDMDDHRCINISVEKTNMFPISINEIIERIYNARNNK